MSSSSQVITQQPVTETNNASGSSKPQAEGDSVQKKRRNNRGRNRKKNPNVLNATEAGTPKPEGEATSTEVNKKPANKKHNNKPKAAGNTNTIARISKNRAQGRLTENTPEESNETSSTGSPSKKKSNNNRSRKPSKLPPGDHDMSTVLTHELKNATYECMVCMDVVRPAHHVWNCDCCWAVFHLNCIQTWATRSLKGKVCVYVCMWYKLYLFTVVYRTFIQYSHHWLEMSWLSKQSHSCTKRLFVFLW